MLAADGKVRKIQAADTEGFYALSSGIESKLT
jgi:hypothetical protein